MAFFFYIIFILILLQVVPLPDLQGCYTFNLNKISGGLTFFLNSGHGTLILPTLIHVRNFMPTGSALWNQWASFRWHPYALDQVYVLVPLPSMPVLKGVKFFQNISVCKTELKFAAECFNKEVTICSWGHCFQWKVLACKGYTSRLGCQNFQTQLPESMYRYIDKSDLIFQGAEPMPLLLMWGFAKWLLQHLNLKYLS